MARKPRKKVPTIKPTKKDDGRPLAADGSRRGRVPGSKNRSTELLEEMQRMASAKFGIENFDPVVMLVQLGIEASEDRIKVDYKGDIEYELDDDGAPLRHPVTGDPIPVITPADKVLATASLAKAAPYVRSTLKQIELTDKNDGPIDADVVGAKQRLAQMAGIELLDEATDDDGTEDT